MKKLKALAIIGTSQSKFYESILPHYQNNPDAKILGDGKQPLTLNDLKQLSNLVDRHTRIDIYAHGLNPNNVHVISIMERPLITADFFKILTSMMGEEPLQIHLWSCYGGLAADYVKYLPLGSALVAHAEVDKKALKFYMQINPFQFAKYNDILLQLLEDYGEGLGHSFVASINVGYVISYSYYAKFTFVHHGIMPYVKRELGHLVHNLKNFCKQADGLIDSMAFSIINYPGITEDFFITDKKNQKLISNLFIHGCAFEEDFGIMLLYDPKYKRVLKEVNDPLVEGKCLDVSLSNQDIILTVALFYSSNYIKNQGKLLNKYLFTAVESSNIGGLQELIKYGADVNAYTKDGNTLLGHATALRDEKVVEFLLKNGADPNLESKMI